ncbi:MAG: DMT family transporter [Candidatus Taylorbacteria bacterium]|nr:DMT family transporter [Candidatus Taylorbacteria bacterium]
MTWVPLALIASVFKSLATISEKEILTKESTANYIAGVSFIIAICSLPLLYFTEYTHISAHSFWLIYIFSIFSVVSALSMAFVVKHLDISESSALFATTPIAVGIFGTIFIGEILTATQVAGIIVSSLGLFILEFRHKNRHGVDINKKEHDDDHPIYGRKKLYTILIIGLVAFGLSSIGDRYLIFYKGVDPMLFLVIIQLCISLNMFAYEIVKNAFMKPTETRLKLIDPELLLQKSFWGNVIFIISHRVTHMFAINLVAAGVLNAAKQINAVFTTILGGKLFHEEDLLRRTIACLVIISGAVLVIL